MKIAFQTLACPDWSWEKTLDEAVRLGYEGIELRGVEGELYLPKARPFLPENLESTIADLRRRKLEICCLDSSCAFHDDAKYDAAIREGRETIELASKLGTKYVRVFGDIIPQGSTEEDVVRKIAKGLTELGNHAEPFGVKVLLEMHGDINNHRIIKAILDRTESKGVGLLWDFESPHWQGEAPEVTWRELGPYIFHTHVKDGYRTENGRNLCLIGDGEVPVAEIISILKRNGYDGFLSLEYEKKWVPELEEPEVSLPHFMAYVKQQLG